VSRQVTEMIRNSPRGGGGGGEGNEGGNGGMPMKQPVQLKGRVRPFPSPISFFPLACLRTRASKRGDPVGNPAKTLNRFFRKRRGKGSVPREGWVRSGGFWVGGVSVLE